MTTEITPEEVAATETVDNLKKETESNWMVVAEAKMSSDSNFEGFLNVNKVFLSGDGNYVTLGSFSKEVTVLAMK